eukprot:1839380-Pyramimonas_sp.AAC.1
MNGGARRQAAPAGGAPANAPHQRVHQRPGLDDDQADEAPASLGGDPRGARLGGAGRRPPTLAASVADGITADVGQGLADGGATPVA